MEGNQQKMREALDRIGNIAWFVSENCGDQETAKIFPEQYRKGNGNDKV